MSDQEQPGADTLGQVPVNVLLQGNSDVPKYKLMKPIFRVANRKQSRHQLADMQEVPYLHL